MPSTPTLEELVLPLLAEAGDEVVAGEFLTGKLGLTRAAVFRAIESLRLKGYRIDTTRTGYRLLAIPNRISALELAPLLDTRELGREVRYEESTESTQLLAHTLAADGAPHGTLVVAEEQTTGRGRRGRHWMSPSGLNLYFSLLLRPALPPMRAPELTLVAAVALCEALEDAGCEARIKWPNDLELGGRKVAGILTELSAEPGRISHVILGIGVNLNSVAEDFPEELRQSATSVRQSRGNPVPRALFCAALLGRLEAWLDRHEDHGFAPVLEAIRQKSSTLHARVRVTLENRELLGEAVDLDETGALLVRGDDGEVERVVAGDVERLRRT